MEFIEIKDKLTENLCPVYSDFGVAYVPQEREKEIEAKLELCKKQIANSSNVGIKKNKSSNGLSEANRLINDFKKKYY